MRLICVGVAFLVIIQSVTAGGGPGDDSEDQTNSKVSSIVKGVSEADDPKYIPSADGKFKCFDGSRIISFSAVNDDYCDCKDGSDEPGTSACLNGHFTCRNKGHVAAKIPSSRVNDGICDVDCCDGTDELLGNCPDVCKEAAKRSKEHATKTLAASLEGARVKATYLRRHAAEMERKNKLARDIEAEMSVLKSQFDRAKSNKEDLEAQLSVVSTQVDAISRSLNLRRQNSLLKSWIGTMVGSSRTILRFSSDDLMVGPDSISKISSLKAVLVAYEKDTPVIEDLVDGAVYTKEMLDRLDKLEKQTKDMKEWFAKFVDIFEHEDEKDFTPETIGSIKSALDAVAPILAEKGELDHVVQPDRRAIHGDLETLKATAQAVEAYKKLKDQVDTKDRELKNLLEDNGVDLGFDGAFGLLKNTCITYDAAEYTYELCFFNSATQRSKQGGAQTSLGTWKGWTGKDLSQFSGKNLKYTEGRFGDGLVCWNGPARSVTIAFECGKENKILSFAEPNKCEYESRVTTSALCEVSEDIMKEVESAPREIIHDEL